MAVNAKEYLEQLAQTAGLDAETKSTLLKAVENEKFATALAASVSRQEDYSRNMDALRKDRETFETDKGSIQSWKDWYAQATAREAEIQAELEDLRKKASGNGGSGGGNSDKVGMTREDLDKILAGERGNMISVIKAMGTISSRHAAEFHEALDVSAVEKIALEKRITVEQAYEQFVAPRIQAKKDEEFAAKLKAAHDDGVKEGLSKVGLPDDSAAPRGHHVLFDRPRATDGKPAAPAGLRERAANFVEAWNSGNATKQ